MNNATRSITLNCDMKTAIDYISDMKNLPAWAIHFAKEVREENGKFIVCTPGGQEFPMETLTHIQAGTVDFVGEISPELKGISPSRLIELPGGKCAYFFSSFQWPGMPDEAFQGQVHSLEDELVRLKQILEAN